LDRETLEIIKKLAKALRKEGLKIDGIVVFGSASRGENGPDSDIDIAVISRDFASLEMLERMRIISRTRFRARIFDRPMDTLAYTPEELEGAEEGSFLGDEIKEKEILVRV